MSNRNIKLHATLYWKTARGIVLRSDQATAEVDQNAAREILGRPYYRPCNRQDVTPRMMSVDTAAWQLSHEIHLSKFHPVLLLFGIESPLFPSAIVKLTKEICRGRG